MPSSPLRRAVRHQAKAATTATTRQAMIGESSQPNWLPPMEKASNNGVAATISSPAPSQSVGWRFGCSGFCLGISIVMARSPRPPTGMLM